MILLYDVTMDKLKWIIFGVIVVAVFGGIILFNKPPDSNFSGDANKVITEGPIADYFVGPAEGKVTLIEYGDFQCPACGRMFSTVQELKSKYPNQLTFIFRERPLTNIHPNALAAATAAEAAGLQGKFFAMHDLLYQSQTAWSSASTSERTSIFEGFASQLGLDMDKFKTDLKSPDISAKIARDRETANSFKADSTPTFILNGQKLPESDAINPEALTKLVDDAVKQAFPQAPAQ